MLTMIVLFLQLVGDNVERLLEEVKLIKLNPAYVVYVTLAGCQALVTSHTSNQSQNLLEDQLFQFLIQNQNLLSCAMSACLHGDLVKVIYVINKLKGIMWKNLSGTIAPRAKR